MVSDYDIVVVHPLLLLSLLHRGSVRMYVVGWFDWLCHSIVPSPVQVRSRGLLLSSRFTYAVVVR
jgi:hypothetical protein